MSDAVASSFIHIARNRLCVHLTGQIRTCLGALRPGQIWWRPNDASNAIGNLVLHCAGSTRFYIGHVVGEHHFVRDREAEFSAPRELTAAELIAHLEAAVDEADEVLSALDPARLLATAERAPKPSTVMEVIALQLAHYALHAGQIAYATKLLDAHAIGELWRTTPTA